MAIRDESFSIAACVAAHARSFPDRVAVDEIAPPGSQRLGTVAYGDVKQRWTYADLWQRTEAIAAALTPVEPGRHGPMVGVMLPNGADHIVAYLACQLIGAAAVPINTQLTSPEIDFILSDSGASVLLTSDPFLDTAGELGADVIIVDAAAIEPVGERDAPPLSEALGEHARNRLAVIAYTSGTTGFPKGVIVRNSDLLDRSAQWAWTFGLSPTQVLSTPGPIYHMSYGGLSLAHLVAGGYNRVLTEFDATFALTEYAEHSSWVFLVPSMTAMINEAWRGAGGPVMGRLEVVLSSGAPGPTALLDAAFDMFPTAAIVEAYGWTEGGWVTYEHKDRNAIVPHCVGWPMMRSAVALLDDDDQPCQVGEPGEVVARPLTPFHGYLGRDDATRAAATSDGYCRSGDVGILLPDGRLTIVDRLKDMIISGGENVYCAEVERVLAEAPGVNQVAVFGLPDDRWGERVTAAVVLDTGADMPVDELMAYARANLAGYKAPKEFHIVDELPRNSMGKVQKFTLVETLSSAPASG
ncbi:MAG: class I adenylate-forming enzyme family protein [Acidimicrobiales bacterium]